MVTRGAGLLGQWRVLYRRPVPHPSCSLKPSCRSVCVCRRQDQLLCPRGRFLGASACGQSCHEAHLALNRSPKGLGAPRSEVLIGELKPQSLAFCRWNDTRSHQLGTQPGFMFLLTLEPFYWVFTRLLMLAKARLVSHSWLSFTDPGELLTNLWGVCQLDRRVLAWISPFLFALLLWPPGSNHSKN